MNGVLALAESIETTLAGIGGGLVVLIVGAMIVGFAKLTLGTDKRTAVDDATLKTRFEEHTKRDDERYTQISESVKRIESTTVQIRDSVARLETKVEERTEKREPTGSHQAVSAVQLAARKP